jgi:hypothetical protein
MEPEGSLPHLQAPPPVPILSQINPVHAPTYINSYKCTSGENLWTPQRNINGAQNTLKIPSIYWLSKTLFMILIFFNILCIETVF